MLAFSELPKTPRIRPMFNALPILDIVTGSWVRSTTGGWILNGGLNTTNANSIAGPGNTFKSEVTNHLFFSAVARYGAHGLFYDTENSMTYERLQRTAHHFKELEGLDFDDPNNEPAQGITFTQSADILGDAYFDSVKSALLDRCKGKQKLFKTPMVDKDGQRFDIMRPVINAYDSLTEFKVSAVQDKLVDKHKLGEGGANTQFMKDGAAKTQMITQLPNLGTQSNTIFMMVAHIGMKIEMDQYAPKAPTLTHSRSGRHKKGVPEKFGFVNGLLMEIESAKPLQNSGDKTARYPKTDSDKLKESADLNEVQVTLTRNKYGPSGVKLTFVISQAEGLLPELTNFHFLKEEKWGFSGNDRNYTLDLCPDITLSRTTIREKIDAHPELCRALEIATQMRMMEIYWRGLMPEIHCSLSELYDRIIAQGYDWKDILNTRDYWLFEEDEGKSDVRQLTTMDILQMAVGNYQPVHIPKASKVKKAA